MNQHRQPAAAFSLTEVVIAMGVATVAFTSIIALFPLGLSMNRESFESTQAALIAKSILSQVVDVQGTTANMANRLLNAGTNNDPSLSSVVIKAGTYPNETNVYLAYIYATNSDGRNFWKPAPTNGNTGIKKSDWDAGIPNSTALVRVTLRRLFDGGSTNDVHLAEVQVDMPGNLSTNNRTREIFSRICR